MEKQHKKYLIGIGAVVVSLVIISLIISFVLKLNIFYSLRIIFGSVYVLFIPGFILTYIFFPKTKEFENEERETRAIDWIERIALSFALSIAIVPLAVFYLNLIGLKINLLNSFFTILFIIISGIILFYKEKKYKKD